jgi:gas vesicle protein
MNKTFSFLTGALTGALIGAVTALLLTPASGPELIQAVDDRWELTKAEARLAAEEKRLELERDFYIAKES